MTFCIFLAIASVLTYFSFRYINILLSLAASISWLSLMAYNTTNPPTNITVGSTVHEWMTYVFVIVAIAIMYMWFMGRRSKETITRVGMGDGEIVAATRTETTRDSLENYQKRVRKALHPGRRGR